MKDLPMAIVAALMWGPKTRDQLVGEVSDHLRSIDRALTRLKHYGLVYRHASEDNPIREDGNRRTGHRTVIWALSEKPFTTPDRVDRYGRPL